MIVTYVYMLYYVVIFIVCNYISVYVYIYTCVCVCDVCDVYDVYDAYVKLGGLKQQQWW